MNFKIIIVISICFILAITSLYFFNEWHRSQHDIEKLQDNWYNKKLDPDRKKIFIIGASYVKPLNSTHIEKTLFKNGYDYDVYNLGLNADRFVKREKYTDNIISSNPDIVILGFSYAETKEAGGDRTSILQLKDAKPTSVLPDPKESLTNIFNVDQFFGIDFSNFENPKLTSLQVINLLFGEGLPRYDLNSKEPFMKGNELKNILKNEELENRPGQKWLTNGGPDFENKNVIALKKMVKKYEENGIKVIVYVVPFNENFWNIIGKSNEEEFVTLLNNLSDELEITIYDYHNYYSDLEIWVNLTHLAKHSKNLIYSEDLANIVLEEIG